MAAAAAGWTVFDADLPVLTYTYSFGIGVANSLAVGGQQGLIVVSPPYRAAQSVFEDLERRGKVRALVASNAFHHMGIPEWKRRYPNAAVFAPAQAIARVRKQTGLDDLAPLARMGAIPGDDIEFVDMPYYRMGEALVRIHTARGLAWYVTDLILNFRELPRHPVIRTLFKLSGSGPGLRFNRVAPLFMVRDRAALRKWERQQFEQDKPRWLLPTHGEVFDVAANPQEVRALFR